MHPLMLIVISMLLGLNGLTGNKAIAADDFPGQIAEQRKRLKGDSKNAEARQRLAEIGWTIAEQIEDAESKEDKRSVLRLADLIESRLGDIGWRTSHYADNKGDARAQLAAGTFHRRGILLERNRAKSCANYRKATASGNSFALWQMSKCVVKENPSRARELIALSANAGNPQAQQVLAEIWLTSGEPHQRKDSVKLLEQAASQQRKSATLLLAALYETGTVVGKDIRKAAEMYRSVATLGHPVAQNNLGALYQREGDFAQAGEWYRKAAEAGLPVAQMNYGLLFTGGEKPWDDDCVALGWVRKASEGGFEMAEKVLKSPTQYGIECN